MSIEGLRQSRMAVKKVVRAAVAGLAAIAVSATFAGVALGNDISANLSGGPNPTVRGQDISFTAVVSVEIPGLANTSWQITLPANLTFVSLSPILLAASSFTCSTPAVGSSGTVSCSKDGTIVGGPGATGALWQLVVNSTNDSASTRSATMTVSAGGDPDGSNNTSTAIISIVDASSTTLASSANPSTFGQSVTYTATVSASAGTPTGDVTFRDGATTLGTVALSGTTATLSTSSLTVGSHSITATYNGDANHGSSVGALTQTVNKANTTTTLGSSQNPSTYNQSVTFTATVTNGATGNVTFKDGATTLGTVAISGTTASYSTTTLTGGSHSITATYNGNGNYNDSISSTLTQTVNKANSTTTLGSSQNPSTYNQSVTFTATVTNGTTGNVTFKDGATTLDTVVISGTTATYTTSSLAAGSHSITATYNGDGNYTTSTSSALGQTVEEATTTVVLASSANPSTSWQDVTLTATVSAQNGTPTGTVTFKDGGTTLAARPLANGQATFATDALKPGRHRIVATYNGGGGYSAANSSTLQQTVNPHVGAEFRVNTTTAGSQQQPVIARLAGDGFAVVWTSGADANAAPDIFAQRYRSNGAKVGSEFRVNVAAMKTSTRPAVSGLADGGFVVIWQTDAASTPSTATRSRGGGGSGGAIVAQRFNKNGAKAGGEFEVGPAAAGRLAEPAVAGLANGGFAAVWNLGEGHGVVGRLFNAAGTRQGQDLRVTPANAKDPAQPAIAALSGGGFVVAWQEGAASSRAIAGQRVKATGANEGAVIRFGTGARSTPALAGLSDGGFAAAWQAAPGDGSGLGIFAERYGSNGARQTAAFRVNAMRTDDQWQPVMSSFANGGFIVAWSSSGQDGSGHGVYAQGYMTSATPVFAEFRANTTVAQNQWQPAIAAFTSGQLVSAWTSANQDGALEGVYGQRFDLMGLTGE